LPRDSDHEDSAVLARYNLQVAGEVPLAAREAPHRGRFELKEAMATGVQTTLAHLRRQEDERRAAGRARADHKSQRVVPACAPS
jgi:hypothetical protein